MAEPQPPNVQEGSDPPDVLPANEEDRKAARALSSLDSKDDESTVVKKEVDLKALNDAMNRLTVGQGQGSKTTEVKKEPKKLVKVDQADVTLLAEHLDLSKTKATELLRAHDANALNAMTAWITTIV